MYSVRSFQESSFEVRKPLTESPPELNKAVSDFSNTTGTTCPLTDDSDSMYGLDLDLHTIKEVEEDDDDDSNGIVRRMDSDEEDYDGCLSGVTAENASNVRNVTGHVMHDTQVLPQQQNTPNEETAGAVCFGWIRHPTTREWRDTVKIFSENRSDFPSWTDDICVQVKQLLQQKGVYRFLVCSGGNGTPKKKRFDDLGTWRPATGDEILKRTKQRFNDERKPQAQPSPTGVKRKRGRPKKVKTGDISPSMTEMRIPFLVSPTNISVSLQHELAKCRSNIESIWTLENMQIEESYRLTVLREHLLRDNDTISCEERSRLWQVVKDIAYVEKFVCHQLQGALGIIPTVVTSQDQLEMPRLASSGLHEENQTCDEFIVEQTEVTMDDSDELSGRQPLYPIHQQDVCFEWNQHDGTDKFLDVVNEISMQTQEYPAWDETVCDRVREKLGEGVKFFSFLGSDGQPSTTIHDGKWYPATTEEIIKKTKDQFIFVRELLKEVSNVAVQNFGTPPSGGSNGGDSPSGDSEGNDDPPSDSKNHGMGGHSHPYSSDFSALQDGTYQSDFSLDPVTQHSSAQRTCIVPTEQEPSTVLTVTKADEDVLPQIAPIDAHHQRALPTIDEKCDTSHETEIQELQSNPVEDDSSVDSELDKVSNAADKTTIYVTDANVIGSIGSNLTTERLYPLVTAECSVVSVQQHWMQVNHSQIHGSEFPDMTKTHVEKDSTEAVCADPLKQKIVIVTHQSCESASEKATSGSSTDIVVRRTTDCNAMEPPVKLERGQDITTITTMQSPPLPTNTELVPTESKTNNPSSRSLTVIDLADRRQQPTWQQQQDRVRPGAVRVIGFDDEAYVLRRILEEVASAGDAYKIISEKLAEVRWSRVLTTLDAQAFGRVISNIKMDFDRPRVAELLASRLLDEDGEKAFTCQHAALAIQNSPFRATMAERLLPYCVDVSSNLSTVKRELQDWDVSLLLISLCRKLQSVTTM